MRRSLLLFVLAFVACADQSSGGAPTSDATPGASSGSQDTSSPSVTAVGGLRMRLPGSRTIRHQPSGDYGIFEIHEENEQEPIRWEAWVRWPAFRVETIFQGNPVVVATQDGERFDVREGDQVGTSKRLGEQGAILLSPLVQFSVAGVRVFNCPSERILGLEVVVGRPAIHVDARRTHPKRGLIPRPDSCSSRVRRVTAPAGYIVWLQLDRVRPRAARHPVRCKHRLRNPGDDFPLLNCEVGSFQPPSGHAPVLARLSAQYCLLMRVVTALGG